MAHREVAEYLLQQVIQIGAATQAIDIASIELLRLVEIEAVVVRIVEVGPLQPEGLVVHLGPFRPRIGLHLNVVGVERATRTS